MEFEVYFGGQKLNFFVMMIMLVVNNLDSGAIFLIF